MKKNLLLLAACGIIFSVQAQIVVNPDGSHSAIHGNVIVNPDGNHSVVHGNVIVNPDGSHSIRHGHGRNRTFVDEGSSNSKVIINIGGLSIRFDDKKSYKKTQRLVRREMRRINRRAKRP